MMAVPLVTLGSTACAASASDLVETGDSPPGDINVGTVINIPIGAVKGFGDYNFFLTRRLNSVGTENKLHFLSL
jgi:hypothetical protein